MESRERAGAAPTATAAATTNAIPAAASGTAGAAARDTSPATEPQSGTGDTSGSMAETVDGITISCLTNAHYHSGREAFLDNVHRWFMFGVIALGAAALIDIFPASQRDWVKGLCTAGAAILGALDLTFDLSNRARSHSMMRRRYFELLADVREGKKTPGQARVDLERLSGDEEPPYRVLLLSSWNQAQRSVYGNKALNFAITKTGMLFKNFFRRPGASYPVTEINSEA
ncbi:MAG TPA: hypothetical protein VND95_00590 [Stellaceae bacterium]|nr:hypothetical protein [Stellaceae bacterium]